MKKEASVLVADIEEVLLDYATISARTGELAAQIAADYQGKDLIMVGILNGAVVFYVDLMMELAIPLEMNFMRVSSYGAGTKSSGNVRVLYDLEVDITAKHVLLVEDIIDSGNTLHALKELLLRRGAQSVKCCCLLDEKEKREVPIEADYVGFVVPDKFLVGYGLDYAGKYRNLKMVGTLRKEIYEQ